MTRIVEALKSTFGLGTRSRDWSVDIGGAGPCGSVTYRDTSGMLACYWEFGGGDTVATIGVGTEAEWTRHHRWAAARRTEILRRIADEVIRQKAPGCRAEIDDQGGFINIR